MTYLEFIKELTNRFGEDQGLLMALRAEVGFLRRYIENHSTPDFVDEQQAMIADFLDRHPKNNIS
jgi:hypothetical protein